MMAAKSPLSTTSTHFEITPQTSPTSLRIEPSRTWSTRNKELGNPLIHQPTRMQMPVQLHGASPEEEEKEMAFSSSSATTETLQEQNRGLQKCPFKSVCGCGSTVDKGFACELSAKLVGLLKPDAFQWIEHNGLTCFEVLDDVLKKNLSNKSIWPLGELIFYLRKQPSTTPVFQDMAPHVNNKLREEILRLLSLRCQSGPNYDRSYLQFMVMQEILSNPKLSKVWVRVLANGQFAGNRQHAWQVVGMLLHASFPEGASGRIILTIGYRFDGASKCGNVWFEGGNIETINTYGIFFTEPLEISDEKHSELIPLGELMVAPKEMKEMETTMIQALEITCVLPR